MKTEIVKFKDLGPNCWLAVRFCGGRCSRVMRCTYPEKRTCKAVDTEIEHLQSERQHCVSHIDKQIELLQKMKGLNNMKMLSPEEIEKLGNQYTGKRIRAIEMPEDPHPVPAGTEGTCLIVDGAGQLVMKWDNGSTLSLLPGVDKFEIIALKGGDDEQRVQIKTRDRPENLERGSRESPG